MISSLLAVSALTLIPYEPDIDCADPHTPNPTMVIINVIGGGEIQWNYQTISQKKFESYLGQERARKPEDRDVFRVYRDDASLKAATDIVSNLKQAQARFGKNCLPIP